MLRNFRYLYVFSLLLCFNFVYVERQVIPCVFLTKVCLSFTALLCKYIIPFKYVSDLNTSGIYPCVPCIHLMH